MKDYECNCGKYKRMKHRGVVCEKCGVEVIQSKVRRERMGHIKLATPVAHIWFLKTLPSRIGNMLDITLQGPREGPLLRGVHRHRRQGADRAQQRASSSPRSSYRKRPDEYGDDAFDAGMGAEAIREMLKQHRHRRRWPRPLRDEMREATSEAKRKKIAKRLKVVEAFREVGQPARVDDARPSSR